MRTVFGGEVCSGSNKQVRPCLIPLGLKVKTLLQFPFSKVDEFSACCWSLCAKWMWHCQPDLELRTTKARAAMFAVFFLSI